MKVPEEEEAPAVPTEIIVYGILVRLDVKSILRYCSVHPQWRSLINHPSFADLHYPQSHDAPRRLLIAFFDPKLQKQFLYSAPACGGQGVRHPITLPSSSNPHGFRLSESAAGLVCLYDDDVAYVCNPSTLQTLRLPPSGLQIEHARIQSENRMYAIGYDPKGGVYKVVRSRLCKLYYSRCCWEDPQFMEVLTLGGSGAWRTLQLPEGWRLELCGHELFGCPANGAIHYRAARRIKKNELEHVILAFVVESEEFRVIPAPPVSARTINSHHGSTLLEIGGKLGLQDHFRSTLWIREEELWRISDIQVTEEPWLRCIRLSRGTDVDGTKIATIQLEDGREIIMNKHILYPWIYPSKRMVHGFNTHELGTCCLNYVHYMETLFSLDNTVNPTLAIAAPSHSTSDLPPP